MDTVAARAVTDRQTDTHTHTVTLAHARRGLISFYTPFANMITTYIRTMRAITSVKYGIAIAIFKMKP